MVVHGQASTPSGSPSPSFGRGHPFRPAQVAGLDERGLAVTVLPPGLELDLVGLADEPEDDVVARSAMVDGDDLDSFEGSGSRASTSPRFRRSSGLMCSVARSMSPASSASQNAVALSRTVSRSIGHPPSSDGLT